MVPGGKRLRGRVDLLRAVKRRSYDEEMRVDWATPVPPPLTAWSKQTTSEADLRTRQKPQASAGNPELGGIRLSPEIDSNGGTGDGGRNAVVSAAARSTARWRPVGSEAMEISRLLRLSQPRSAATDPLPTEQHLPLTGCRILASFARPQEN